MTWRFRKRIKILPGLWINLSKGPPSLSIGGRGATTNISKRGVASTVGLPGTGISYRFGPKRTRKKSTPPTHEASALPSDPLALKGRRLLEIIDQLKVLPPLDGEHDPLPGLKQRLEVLGEGIELLRDIQAIRPGEPIERALKSFEALLEWTQINYTDHTEETADAEKNADADFQANKLTDQQWEAFWRHIGAPWPDQHKKKPVSSGLGCRGSLVLGFFLLVLVGLVSHSGDRRTASYSATAALVIKEPTEIVRAAEPVGLPDHNKTPGATIAGVTVEQLRERGWAKRQHAKVTAEVRRAVFERYGIPPEKRKLYTIDHLVSVETGGASELTNLWPQLLRCRYDHEPVLRDMIRQVLARHAKELDPEIWAFLAEEALEIWYCRTSGCPDSDRHPSRC